MRVMFAASHICIHGACREIGTFQNQLTELWDGDSFLRIALKNAAQDNDYLVGKRQDCSEKKSVL
jgi:hypothetical protein